MSGDVYEGGCGAVGVMVTRTVVWVGWDAVVGVGRVTRVRRARRMVMLRGGFRVCCCCRC